MKAGDLFLTFMIILIFVAIYAFNILSIGMANIKKNWPVYRCNPMIKPFASYFGHEPVSNFTYCIQNMQTDYMGYLMQPLTYNLGILTKLGEFFTTVLENIRGFLDYIRNSITSIVKNVFGVFINILVEFQKIFK